MLVRSCSKSFKIGFSSTWNENFQMYKVGLEKAEGPAIKCQHLLDHRECREIPEKYLLLLHWLHKSLWLCGSQQSLKEVGIPDHLTCLLRNLYVGQEAIVRTLHGTTDWFKIGRSTTRLYIVTLLFNSHADYITQNTELNKSQAGINIARRNDNLRYADDTTVRAESEGELNSLLMRVKEESEKAGWKLNI